MTKLNQILAVEKSKKKKINDELSELYKAVQKPDLMNGHRREYTPRSEDGEEFPPEEKQVQYEYKSVFALTRERLEELFNLTAKKDWTNCKAKASIELDGKVFLEDVPVTYLLFLEKQLNDLHALVSSTAELDSGVKWSSDPNSGLFTSSEVKTQKVKKVKRPIVLYEATDKHPAQVQLADEDVVVGTWSTVKLSGAIPRPKKLALLERIQRLQDAVKFAREQANNIDAERVAIGDKVLSYVFSDL